MKKLQHIGLVTLSAALFACGGGDASTTETESAVITESAASGPDYSKMEMTNLFDFGIDASLYIPNQDKGPHKLSNSAIESTEIMVGDKFGIEVIPFGSTVAEKKAELAGDLVYTIEFVEETTDKIVYKRSIAESDIDPEFHFFLTTEINGEIYSIKSLDKAYSEKAIQSMITSAESLKANVPA